MSKKRIRIRGSAMAYRAGIGFKLPGPDGTEVVMSPTEPTGWCVAGGSESMPIVFCEGKRKAFEEFVRRVKGEKE